MDKNEILEKSRRENGEVDERFRAFNQRMSYFVVCVMLAVWAVLFIWDTARGQSTSVGSAIMLSGVATMSFCRFYQLRMKSMLFFGALAAFGAASFAVEHVLATL